MRSIIIMALCIISVTGCQYAFLSPKTLIVKTESGFLVFATHNRIFFVPAQIDTSMDIVYNFKSKRLGKGFLVRNPMNDEDLRQAYLKAEKVKILKYSQNGATDTIIPITLVKIEHRVEYFDQNKKRRRYYETIPFQDSTFFFDYTLNGHRVYKIEVL